MPCALKYSETVEPHGVAGTVASKVVALIVVGVITWNAPPVETCRRTVPAASGTPPPMLTRIVVVPSDCTNCGSPFGNVNSTPGQSQTPCGLASAACSAVWLLPVPALEPLVEVQPPWVWMPMAWLVPSRITGEPELPPVVSAV